MSVSATGPLGGQRILLCVGGGIAAYKALELVRRLRDAGAQVQVAMTAGAQQFVTPLSFQALSGHPAGLLAVCGATGRNARLIPWRLLLGA